MCVILQWVVHIHKINRLGDHIRTIKMFFFTFTRDKSKRARRSRGVWHIPLIKVTFTRDLLKHAKA